MDANPASAGANGFDAALKALEDLESSVDQPAARLAPAAPSIGAIGFSDSEDDEESVVMAAAASLLEVDDIPVEPAADPAPVALAEPAADIAAAPVPSSPQVAAALPASARLLKFAVGLGLFSSLISATGLIVAERAIMSAQLVVADARERQRQLEQSNKLIQDLELVRDRQVELLQAQRAQLATGPVTSDELAHRMTALQQHLAERDPLNAVVEAIRSGQADNNARFNEFGLKMARVEAALDRR